MHDQGGWLWLLIDVVMVGALGAAIAYGSLQWSRRRERLSRPVAPEYDEPPRR
jgi:hypothetical protein